MSRLLMVEDDESQLRSLTAVMEEEGVDVIGCSSASEALGHLRLLDAGVAVVDLRLGDLSEKELLANLSVYAGRVNFIINTAYSSFESAKDALNLGAFAYVEKAGDPDELVRHVHRAFQASLHSYADELEAAVAERTRELREVNEALKKDITDRKRAEEALRESEEKFKDIFEHANDAIIYLDGCGKVLDVNGMAVEIFGGSKKELLNKHFTELEIISGGEIPQLMRDFEGILTGREATVTVAIRNKKVEEIILECSGSVVKTGDGDARMMVIARDISERKKAELALEVERDKLVSILESMEDGVYIVDREHHIQYVNPVLRKDFGPFEGKKCYVYFHDREEVCPWCKNQDVFAGKTVRWEWYSFKNQKTYDLVDTPLKNVDGSISKLEIFRDITERKRAEEALKKSRDLLEKIFLSLDSAMFILGNKVPSNIIDCNPAATRIFGYEKDEVVGKTTEFLHASRDTLSEFQKALYAAIESQGCLSFFEFTMKRKNGEVFATEHSVVPLRDEKGKRTGWVSVVSDITERKAAEEQLREHQAELARVWRVNTMGEMASGLAHELNQPLCAILNYANACLRMTKRGTDEPAKVTEALEQIASQTDRAGQIIRRIRSLVAKRKPRQSTVDVNGVVREVVEMQKAEASQKGITVRTELAEDLPLILADGVEIEEVVLNLVRNAFDAMSDPALERREVTIRTSVSENNRIEATVTDSGKGLLGEDPENIFDSFFTTKADGLGIGLSISRTIIEGHGGRLWAEPNPDCGVSFRFTLPVAGLWSGEAVRG